MKQALVFPVIRFKQVWRELHALGLFYSMFLAAAFISGVCFYFVVQSSTVNIYSSLAFLVLLCMLIHFNRNDHKFIKLNCDYPFYIYFAEYSIFMFPFVLMSSMGAGSLMPFVIYIPLAIISASSPVKISLSNTSFPVAFIEKQNFEWKSGLRKNGWMLSVLFATAILTTPFPFVSLVILWFMLLIISIFYEFHESREMLESFELPEKKFILVKIIIQVKPFLVASFIVSLISLIFYPERWWISLSFIFFGVLNIAVFVVSKYAVWGAGERHGSVTLLNSLCLLGLFLPFLLPLPFILLLKNYHKSVRMLKPLLHDYNN